MGLIDALLLDPFPFEIWIAKRTDGLAGSGTLNDPWDGSTAARFDQVMNTIATMSADKVGLVHFGTWQFRDEWFQQSHCDRLATQAGDTDHRLGN